MGLGKMTWLMVMVSSFTQMEISMTGNGKITSSVAKASIVILMALFMMVSSKMT